MNQAVDIMLGVGQLVILLVMAFVLTKVGKFIDSLSETIKKD